MDTPPACGVGTPVPTAVLSIITSGVNRVKLEAATNYISTQLEPITTIISDDVSSIISTNYLIVLFIILIALMAIILWLCAELQVDSCTTVCIVLVLLLVAVISFFVFESYARAAVNNVLSEARADLTDQLVGGTLLETVNGAAQEYLATIGITC